MVAVPVRGRGERNTRVVSVRTVWEVAGKDASSCSTQSANGRLGAIVSDYGDVKLVEIADEEGVMLDLIQVPEPRLKLISKHSE